MHPDPTSHAMLVMVIAGVVVILFIVAVLSAVAWFLWNQAAGAWREARDQHAP